MRRAVTLVRGVTSTIASSPALRSLALAPAARTSPSSLFSSSKLAFSTTAAPVAPAASAVATPAASAAAAPAATSAPAASAAVAASATPAAPSASAAVDPIASATTGATLNTNSSNSSSSENNNSNNTNNDNDKNKKKDEDKKENKYFKKLRKPLLLLGIASAALLACYGFLRHTRYDAKKKQILSAANAPLEGSTYDYIADTYMLTSRDLDRIYTEAAARTSPQGAVSADTLTEIVFKTLKAHRDAREQFYAATDGMRDAYEAVVRAERAAALAAIAQLKERAHADALAAGKSHGEAEAAAEAAAAAAPQFVPTAESEALRAAIKRTTPVTQVPLTDTDDWYGDKQTDERPLKPWDPMVLLRSCRPRPNVGVGLHEAMFALANILTDFMPPTHPAHKAFAPPHVVRADPRTLSPEDAAARAGHLEYMYRHRTVSARSRRNCDKQPQQRLAMAWRLATVAANSGSNGGNAANATATSGNELGFGAFAEMLDKMRLTGHFDLDSLMVTDAWPVRWHAQSPKDIAARYYQVLKKTPEERITYAEFEAASYKFAEVKEPHFWYLAPEDISLFGISSAYRRNKWLWQVSRGTQELEVPVPPKAYKMAAAAAVYAEQQQQQQGKARAAAAPAAGAVVSK